MGGGAGDRSFNAMRLGCDDEARMRPQPREAVAAGIARFGACMAPMLSSLALS